MTEKIDDAVLRELRYIARKNWLEDDQVLSDYLKEAPIVQEQFKVLRSLGNIIPEEQVQKTIYQILEAKYDAEEEQNGILRDKKIRRSSGQSQLYRC